VNVHAQPYPADASGRAEAQLPIIQPLERRRLQCHLAFICTDIVAFLSGSWLVGYLYAGKVGADTTIIQAQLALPVFLTIALYNGTYSVTALRQPW